MVAANERIDLSRGRRRQAEENLRWFGALPKRQCHPPHSSTASGLTRSQQRLLLGTYTYLAALARLDYAGAGAGWRVAQPNRRGEVRDMIDGYRLRSFLRRLERLMRQPSFGRSDRGSCSRASGPRRPVGDRGPCLLHPIRSHTARSPARVRSGLRHPVAARVEAGGARPRQGKQREEGECSSRDRPATVPIPVASACGRRLLAQ